MNFSLPRGCRRLSTALGLALAVLGSAEVRADVKLTPEQVSMRKDVACSWSGNGRDGLSLTVNNTSADPIEVDVPAGQVAVNKTKATKMIVLRSAQLRVPPHGSAEASLPAAALASTNALASEPFQPVADAEPRLEGLLKYLSTQPDAPKETAQLATLCLLENFNFEQWQQFLAPQRANEPAGQQHPTPAEVTQAVDALGILRTVAADQKFALAEDSGLKLRALRNPWCRAKAMQLYGITLPTGGADGQVPDLGQLLHTKPGDNCPICRQRALMQQGSDF